MSAAATVIAEAMQLPLRVIQMDAAMYCVDCRSIISAPTRSCPACESRVVVPLAPLLGEMSWESEQGVPVLGIGEGR